MDILSTAKDMLSTQDEVVVSARTAGWGKPVVVALTGTWDDRLRFRRWDEQNKCTYGGAWLARASDLDLLVAV